jgi:heme/copper-type cytochrome/quinol oxidase subunit 4
MTPSPSHAQKKAAAFRRGMVTFVILAVLTALEFWVSRMTAGSPVFLLIIALAKAGLIVQYFMHISSLWSEEAH